MPADPNALRVGVVGTGALGRHHVRILSDLPGAALQGVFDLDQQVAEAVAVEYGTAVFRSREELAEQVEAAVVAVPTVDHTEVGCYLLERGVHILVEKPLAATLEEADRLIGAAREAGKLLAVGHVEYFNPAVQALLPWSASPGFIEVQRLGAFSMRSLDVDVILDLMIHDLQILHALDPAPVAEVRAAGVEVLSSRVDIANARVALASGCVANLTTSRVSFDKIRKLRIFSHHRYLSIDYQRQEITAYAVDEGQGGRAIRREHISVERREPLREELRAFTAACRGEKVRLVSGTEARRALATALDIVRAIDAEQPASSEPRREPD